MKTWPVQDAKARFSELIETCLREGPQLVTRRGLETAVVVPAAMAAAVVRGICTDSHVIAGLTHGCPEIHSHLRAK